MLKTSTLFKITQYLVVQLQQPVKSLPFLRYTGALQLDELRASSQSLVCYVQFHLEKKKK